MREREKKRERKREIILYETQGSFGNWLYISSLFYLSLTPKKGRDREREREIERERERGGDKEKEGGRENR